MVSLGVSLGHESQDRTLQTKIQKAQITDDRDRHDPDAVIEVAQVMQDKRRQKETNGHQGYCSKPTKDYVSCDVAYTQLQARSPLCSSVFARDLCRRRVAMARLPYDLHEVEQPHPWIVAYLRLPPSLQRQTTPSIKRSDYFTLAINRSDSQYHLSVSFPIVG